VIRLQKERDDMKFKVLIAICLIFSMWGTTLHAEDCEKTTVTIEDILNPDGDTGVILDADGEIKIDSEKLDPNIFFSESEGVGGWIGSGGDTQHEVDNIWFMGRKPVRYCIKISDTNEFSRSEIQRLVKESLSEWQAFFRKYRISSRPLAVDVEKFKINLSNGKAPLLSTNFVEFDCSAESLETIDPKDKLYLFFGVENSLIKIYKKLNTENALGLALRKKYNHKSNKNGGFVWIKEFEKSSESKLKHMILHELGHIFGMKHDSVFVMSNDVAEELEEGELYSEEYFGEIESDSWKYRYLPSEKIVLTSSKGRKFKDREDFVFEEGLEGDLEQGNTHGSFLRKIKRPKKPKKPFGHKKPGHKKPGHKKPGPVKPKKGTFVGKFKCKDEQYAPNIFLPRQVIQKYGFKARNCHKVTFSKSTFNSGNRVMKKFELAFTEYRTGRSFTMNGVFSNKVKSRENHPGPGVYSTYKFTNKKRARTRILNMRLTLDREQQELPVRGYFQVMGRKLAAQITSDKGPVVEVFLPNGDWWILKSVHSCSGNEPCGAKNFD
jgi:hypothetical protein